jgi:ABC-type glycerol-3-phosphate transport system permease component
MTSRRRFRPGTIAAEAVLFVAMALILVPVLWLYVSAFQTDINIIRPGQVSELTIINFERMLSPDSAFSQQLRNSAFLVVFTTAMCVTIGLLAAYSLSSFRWPRGFTVAVFGLVLFIQLVPPVTLVPAYYVILHNLGIFDTTTGLVFVNTTFNLPFAVLLLKVYFDRIPQELRESALVDGCSEFAAFRKVLVPLAIPGIAAVTILVAILTWNEFLMALSLTSSPRGQTVTVAIGATVQEYSIRYGLMTGAAALASIPLILLAIVAQRQIMSGLTGGAVKA